MLLIEIIFIFTLLSNLDLSLKALLKLIDEPKFLALFITSLILWLSSPLSSVIRSNLNNNEPNNKNSEVYSKISIVTFSDNNIKTLGSYNNYNSFQKGINQV